MPQAWDLCGRSTLEIVEPINEMISDTDISTLYVSEYSAPTPEGGLTAELVDYATLDPRTPTARISTYSTADIFRHKIRFA